MLGKMLNSFNIRLYDTNVIICKTYFYIVYVFSSFLPIVLILASVDRLLISSQNIGTRMYSSKRLAHFSVSCTTGFLIFSFIHIIIKVNLQEIAPSYFICYYDLERVYLNIITSFTIIFNFGFSLVMIVVCIFAFKNIRKSPIIQRQQQQQQRRIMTKRDFQLLRCLFNHNLIYIIFSIGMSLYPIYQMISFDRSKTPTEQIITDFLSNLAYLIHHVPYCINFYLYFLVSKVFQTEVKRQISRLFCRQHTLINEEEIRQVNDNAHNIITMT